MMYGKFTNTSNVVRDQNGNILSKESAIMDRWAELQVYTLSLFQPRPPMASLFRSLYGMPGLAPRMDVLS